MDMVDPEVTLDILKDRGYAPELRQCTFKTGDRPVAILKDEQFDPSLEIDDEYLMDEWLALREAIDPNAVRLWRGHPEQEATLAVSAKQHAA
jgi:hypothetical protein